MSKNANKEFLKDLNSKIHAFVVDTLNDLIDELGKNTIKDRSWLYPNSKDVYRDKDIGGIIKTLHDSQSPLEFKVNQEIFGKDPDSRFQDLVDFLLWHVEDELFEDFEIFLDGFDIYRDDIPFNDQFVMMLAKEAPKITYTEYFETRRLLKERREQIEKEENEARNTINSKYDDYFSKLEYKRDAHYENERKIEEIKLAMEELRAIMSDDDVPEVAKDDDCAYDVDDLLRDLDLD